MITLSLSLRYNRHMILVKGIRVGLEEEGSSLLEKACKKYRINRKDVLSWKIRRRSIDARKGIAFVYSLVMDVKDEKKYLKKEGISLYEKKDLSVRKLSSDVRPVIVGYGPSGIFAAWRLLEAGLKPVVFERGKRVSEREKDVKNYFENGIFLPESNVVYGEGGAGTFSDAKLTTRLNDPFIDYILDVFVSHGADEDIKIDAHAHIGTDLVRRIIEAITDDMVKRGAEFRFEERVEDFLIEGGVLKGIKTDKDIYPCTHVLLGIGHSAYDTFEKLHEKGVCMEAKDAAVGFRAEHPQSLIDHVQYHGIASEKLDPSEYFLRYKGEKGVYSFCMCPGGYVVPSNAEENSIVTNGMSYHDRGNTLANSAILIQVKKEEYGEGPLAGFEYLRKIERKAYELSGSYKAISMNLRDYVNQERHELLFPSSYPLGTVTEDICQLFPEKDNEILVEALKHFDKEIPGFIDKGILTGPETRSSSPVRILRDETGQSVNTKGLYPMGEGPGYGGGIMSCALDGIRTADRVLASLYEFT